MARILSIPVFRYAAALAIVAGIALFYKEALPQLNQTTVGFSFLLAILAVSALWGMAVAAVMSVAAMLSYNFFFLPPVGTLTIADPQNWVALFAFLVTAIVGSQLSVRIRREADAANQRSREIERLYLFSQKLLEEGNVIQLLNAIPEHLLDAFGGHGAGLFLADKNEFYRSGSLAAESDEERIKAAFVRDEPTEDTARDLSSGPIRLGVRPIGSFGISQALLSRQTLEATGTLIGIAIERARAIEQLSKTEADRQSERLKATLLDAIAHDFRTPLTSIKASVTSLLSSRHQNSPQQHELLTVIDEESDRLNHLVEEAAEMARLEAGEIELELQSVPIAELIDAALKRCRNALGSRQIHVNVPAALPPVRADVGRAMHALVQLLDNANLYSPSQRPIAITAEADGQFVRTSVADQGPGIEAPEQSMIFEKFYRGRGQQYIARGTGMGLAIAKAIVQAHGGAITVSSQVGHGSVFSFTLPTDGSLGKGR
jgi:two-component system sensor histidine kinase KdpD